VTKPDNAELAAPEAAAQEGGDPQTVALHVGAPEHGRAGAREQADRQPAGPPAYGFSPGVGPPLGDAPTRQMPQTPTGQAPPGPATGEGTAAGYSPTTVRVGGYTPPERVPPAGTANTQVRPARVPRRTNLQLQRLEPWSVLKLSLVLSVAGFLVWMVAVGVLYGILAGMGVWDQINGTYSDLTSASNTQSGTQLITGGWVFGTALIVGLVNIVLMTALATVGSLIYNIAADFVGGVEVTLSEPD
jgi:hypothetical protein